MSASLRPHVKTINKKAKTIFESVMNSVFAVILLFITITMLVGTFRLFYRLSDLFKTEGITGGYLYVFTDVLTLFILIELSRSIYEYISLRRLRLTLVIDAAIVFILRDIMIELFKHSLANETAYALAPFCLCWVLSGSVSCMVINRNRRIDSITTLTNTL